MLEETFPEQFQLIERLRSTDPVLDEICRDFELLSQDAAALVARTDHAGRTLQSDTQESLIALAAEIRGRLAIQLKRANTPET